MRHDITGRTIADKQFGFLTRGYLPLGRCEYFIDFFRLKTARRNWPRDLVVRCEARKQYRAVYHRARNDNARGTVRGETCFRASGRSGGGGDGRGDCFPRGPSRSHDARRDGWLAGGKQRRHVAESAEFPVKSFHCTSAEPWRRRRRRRCRHGSRAASKNVFRRGDVARALVVVLAYIVSSSVPRRASLGPADSVRQ